MKEHQPPLGLKEQVDNLKNINLIIDDDDSTIDFLNDVSYFRVIKGYSLGLKSKDTGKYKDNVSFDDIKQLYLFNAKLRHLVFPEIEKVEINLRCRLANYFSLKYGIFGYLNVTNFKNPAFHKTFLRDLDAEIKRNSKLPFVKNFKENYIGGNLPFYAVIELLSFGTLSKFFKNMKNCDKKEIALTYGVTYTYIESWIEHLAFVRNICAHYGRLYNINLSKSPILYHEYSDSGISNLRFFATLICLKHLLPNSKHWKGFIAKIDDLFIEYPKVDKTLMGFPGDTAVWSNFLLWSLDKIRK